MLLLLAMYVYICGGGILGDICKDVSALEMSYDNINLYYITLHYITLEQPHVTAMLLQRGCSFTLPHIDSTQIGDIKIFLKLAC